MNITEAKYTAKDSGKGIKIIVDGNTMYVPISEGNRHYDEVMKQVKAGTLTVRSLKESDDSTSLLHKGIAYRKFERKFTIHDDIVVSNASLENGMLTIKLERIIPEDKKPRLITIN